MLIRILNDVKAGHYFWMRRNAEVNRARSANRGIIFYTLFVYYTVLSIIGAALFYRFFGSSFIDHGLLINALEFFTPYLTIYFLFISPGLDEVIDEDIEELEKTRKKSIAKRYFIVAALLVASVGFIYNLIMGIDIIK
ncbi:hypothetical protein [Dyadobacter fermentans]|uniref:hypothetical protein n=1 Tax=Dyadobacter fermentans TaxID=94254 RepID=UPI001CBFA60D|nr:hypothetical protein [Dyadobacter fermentans]MBZ1362729.1 hypothetical protein [Dyadobacter fermentans]